MLSKGSTMQEQDRGKQTNMEELTSLCDRITIEDEDDFRLVIEQEEREGTQRKPKWCLVGKFSIDRVINS